MMQLVSVLRRGYGIARSTAVYRGNPFKLRRARAFYRQFIRPGDLCFDIGAHVGDRLVHFLSLGARVVAVEPQPRLMAGLKRRFGTDPRVILISAALGAARGKAKLAIDPAHPTVATLSPDYIAQAGESRGFRHVRWREEIEVEVTTLDALIAAHGAPAFCKIDVEGYEHAVIEGLSQPLPGLSLEYLPAALDPALVAIARLNRLGAYRFNRSVGESMALAIPRWLGAAEIGAELKRLPRDEKAGDVYAFLDDGATSR
jgi:FkbM family methyltransferase